MTATPQAFICDAIRTPFGRYGGALSSVRADDLGAVPLHALMARNPNVDWAAVTDVLYGCANQAGEDNRNVARMAALLAGLPVTVAGNTVNRLCASGLQAIMDSARAISNGDAELMIAGGVESMSRAPFVMPKQSDAFGRKTELYDTTLGWRFLNSRLSELYHPYSMGETAENLVDLFSISREDQDLFAFRSQKKAFKAQQDGYFASEIVPVKSADKKGNITIFDQDEFIKGNSTLEKLSTLKPAFRKVGGTVTAGNASGINDGAAAMLLASDAAVKKYGFIPKGRIVASAVVGVEPRIMGIGPVNASKKALEKVFKTSTIAAAVKPAAAAFHNARLERR